MSREHINIASPQNPSDVPLVGKKTLQLKPIAQVPSRIRKREILIPILLRHQG
jgi:hypothetical protein